MINPFKEVKNKSNEIKNNSDNFFEIKPEVARTSKEVKNDLSKIIDEAKNKISEIYKIYKNENGDFRRIPANNGYWIGTEGNSEWRNNENYICSNTQTNPEKLAWGEVTKKHDFTGIQFKNGEPNFAEVSKGTVKIDNFSDNRNKNYVQADIKLAEQQGKTPEEVRAYRKENNLTWHERYDMKTMDLIPREIHGAIPHDGGIARYKKLHRDQLSNNNVQNNHLSNIDLYQNKEESENIHD